MALTYKNLVHQMKCNSNIKKLKKKVPRLMKYVLKIKVKKNLTMIYQINKGIEILKLNNLSNKKLNSKNSLC